MAQLLKRKTAGRSNRPLIKRDSTHSTRQLKPEDQINPDSEPRKFPMHLASSEQARENHKFLLNLAPSEEGHVTPTPPITVPITASPSALLPTSSATALPHLTTPAASRIASNAPTATVSSSSTTASSPSTTSSPQSFCSGGSSCATITTNLLPTATAQPIPDPHPSVSSVGSSSGMIFVGFLAGIALIAMSIAILSYGVKRWCNKRQRSRNDADTWRFLEQTPKNFGYPFLGRQNQPSERIVGYADEKSISNFIDTKDLGWVAPSIPAESHRNGLSEPYKPMQEHSDTYSRAHAIPEVVYPEYTLTSANFHNRATMYAA